MRRCRAILRDEEAALDAMQDVFVQLLRRESELDERGPSSLLYTMATNICLNKIRSQRRNRVDANDELISRAADPSQDRRSNEEFVLTRHFLDRLLETQDETTRVIAYSHYVQGFTLEETAEAVGMSVSGIRKRLRKLRSAGLALRET
jgi:RNA polymerase sigma-70 factor (ECF subfamily)